VATKEKKMRNEELKAVFDQHAAGYEKQWQRMAPTAVEPERLECIRAAYAQDVAILPPQVIASIIEPGGFEAPVQFFQAGLIHAWFSQRR
jgi:hypothetical protein